MSESVLLDGLNQSQQDAVENIEGPMMVIAGAGSGKTRVLTYRIAYMIEQGINPFNILSLTFTNKAAAEMKERVIALLGSDAGRYVWMGTFHSVFSKILHIEAQWLGYTHNFTIYDTSDSKSLIRTIVKELHLNDKLYKASKIQGKISEAKACLMTAEEYENNAMIEQDNAMMKIPQTGAVYRVYEQRLKQADAMDFDDLLMNMYIMLRDFPQLLDKYQKKFRYILVDEYQDTNHAQYKIIKKLAARNENICVVGDDAQSIYSFRGANIQNILNFRDDYPDYKIFKLEQNYRSTKNIISAANSVIKNNQKQIPKIIWTANQEGELIRVLQTNDDISEATATVQSIVNKKERLGSNNKDFVILYRTNSQSRSFEEVLRRTGLPYRIYGGISFYNRKEVKDLIAYFRLTVNQRDEEALRRIINYPQRGIGATTLEKIIAAAGQYSVPLWTVLENPTQFGCRLSKNTLENIENFLLKINSYAHDLHLLNAFELGRHIAENSGIMQDLRQQNEEKERYENLGELLNAMQSFVERNKDLETEIDMETGEETPLPSPSLDRFLNEIALYTDADKEEEDDDNKIKLMTIHAAKGLEFSHVFIVGLEDGLLPFYLIEDENDLEEERRLFYVAITRAKQTLTLSMAYKRLSFGSCKYNQPSPFLQEIDMSLLNIERQNAVRPATPPVSYSKPGNSYASTSAVAKQTFIPRQSVANSSSQREFTVPEHAGKTVTSAQQLKQGMNVFHKNFGTGSVISVDAAENKIVVDFGKLGIKTMLIAFAKVRIVE
jgi:DNA helicase-2/ATP-dependent DNA helicase PcrA